MGGNRQPALGSGEVQMLMPSMQQRQPDAWRGMASSRSTGGDADSQLGSYDELLELDEGNVRRGVSDGRLRSFPVSTVRRPSTSTTRCNVCLDGYKQGQKTMKLP